MTKDKWIQSAIQHRGQLHKDLGVPEDKVIPEEMLRNAANKMDKTGERARLALTLMGMHHDGKKKKKKIKSMHDLHEAANEVASEGEDMESDTD